MVFLLLFFYFLSFSGRSKSTYFFNSGTKNFYHALLHKINNENFGLFAKESKFDQLETRYFQFNELLMIL